MPRRIKLRKLLDLLRALGCRPERTVGSHQVWGTPGGAHVTVVVNHANADVTRTVLAGIRRALRREGLLADDRGGKGRFPISATPEQATTGGREAP